MEGEIGAILGLCIDGWWLGWLRGKLLVVRGSALYSKHADEDVHRLS